MTDDHQQDCQNFWCAAYLAAVSAGFAEDASDTADRALLDYDSRFAPVEEPAPVIDPLPEIELDLLG
jgi:hypothetical protein